MFRNKDNSDRNIISYTLIQNKYAKKDTINDLKTFLSGSSRQNRELALDKFEVYSDDNVTIHNIINKYYITLDDKRYITKITFDDFQATALAERIKSIAKHIYGDTEMYYIIMYLNNISHPSELSKNFLMNNGLLVLSGNGLEKLHDIIKFIISKTASSDYGKDVLAL